MRRHLDPDLDRYISELERALADLEYVNEEMWKESTARDRDLDSRIERERERGDE